MRSRAGFFWCSLWLTLLLLLPLILVVGFLARQRQTQQELRQAAANQSQLQIEPGAQSVWRMLLVVQQEEPPQEAVQPQEIHLQQLRRTSRMRMERLLP